MERRPRAKYSGEPSGRRILPNRRTRAFRNIQALPLWARIPPRIPSLRLLCVWSRSRTRKRSGGSVAYRTGGAPPRRCRGRTRLPCRAHATAPRRRQKPSVFAQSIPLPRGFPSRALFLHPSARTRNRAGTAASFQDNVVRFRGRVRRKTSRNESSSESSVPP